MDEVKMPESAEAQGGGEVAIVAEHLGAMSDRIRSSHPHLSDELLRYRANLLLGITTPPSAPVGVERKYPDDGNGDDDAYNRGWNDCLDALAQQPAAVDGAN